jgi:hypothetical protein
MQSFSRPGFRISEFGAGGQSGRFAFLEGPAAAGKSVRSADAAWMPQIIVAFFPAASQSGTGILAFPGSGVLHPLLAVLLRAVYHECSK